MRVTRRKALVIANYMLDTIGPGYYLPPAGTKSFLGLEIKPKAPPPPEPPGPLMQLAEALYENRMARFKARFGGYPGIITDIHE